MIQIINGDIFDAFEQGCDAICHQVNCQGKMNAGLAKEIAKRYPEVKTDYVELCLEESIDRLLGGYIDTPVKGGHVIGIFGQAYYGDDGWLYTNYDALQKAFCTLNHMYAGHKLAFPYGIGCGLGGGDWNIVLQLIHDEFTECNVVIFRKE